MTRLEYSLIEDAAELSVLLDALAEQTVIAVDTEAASFHRFIDRVYLLQISTPSLNVLIDPMAVDASPLGQHLANDKIEKIFHDADYDLRALTRDFAFGVRHIFDTRIAAQLAGEPSIGLAALLEKYFDVRLSKACQRADWSQRPLTAEMLAYAAADTAFLLRLRDRLQEELKSLGRWSWAQEEFTLAEGITWQKPDPDQPRYLRIKGVRKLGERQRAVLRAVFAWRETEARRLDRAEFRIVPNETLMALATDAPITFDALRRVRPLAGSHRTRYGDALVEAVQQGLDADPEPAAASTRTPDFRRDPAFQTRVDALRAVRNDAADRLQLDPGVLCGRPILEAIARDTPTSIDELRAVQGVRQWQVEVFGDALLTAVR